MGLDVDSLEALNTVALLLCVSFCAYVVLILVAFLRTGPTSAGDADRLAWHFVVPCLNEEAVIGGTVASLLRTFPTATVWCVDDGSDDGTATELGLFADDPRVRLVRRRAPEARQGKGAALNAAWRAIQRDVPLESARGQVIVGVVDADSRLDPDCLSALAGPTYFGDATVSAVQIEVRMANHGSRRWGRLLVRLQDMEFRAPIAAMQTFRRRTGSVAMGGNGQFTRLSTLDAIAARHGTPWHGALLEDFELGLHVLLTGGRTAYCSHTWVAQEGLTQLRTLIRQRARWAQGSMQCGRYLPAVVRSRDIGNPAVLEICYFLAAPWLQIGGSLVYGACLSVLAWYANSAPGSVVGWWQHGGWLLIPLVVLFGICPLAVWGIIYRRRCRPELSRRAAIGLGLCHWLYSYLQCLAVWWALYRQALSRSEWQKTRRIADAVPPASPCQPNRTGSGAHVAVDTAHRPVEEESSVHKGVTSRSPVRRRSDRVGARRDNDGSGVRRHVGRHRVGADH